MADDEDAMIAGFQSARPKESTPSPSSPKPAGRPIKAERHRETRAQARDPAAAQLINSRELQQIVDRVVRLTEEKTEVQDSIKAEFAGAKEKGYDVKALRVVVKRAMEDEAARAARVETEDTAEAMMRALGMLAGTPLGEAAMVATH